MTRTLKVAARMVVVAYQTFGLRRALSTAVYAFFPFFTWFTLWLDRIFFPNYRKVKVERPTFIIGHPRSGTTFFHRLLNQTDELVTFALWELMVPSLTARRLLRPLIGLFFKLYYKDMEDGSSIFDEGFHDTDMDSIEEEELLYYPIFETQFAIAFTPLAFDEREYPDIIFPDSQPRARQKRNARYLRECLQRQIHATGKKQVMAKLPYSTLRLKALAEEFPDARFVYLMRSPLETIPSHLSLHRSFFKHRWGLDKIPKERLERYYRRRYRYNLALYRYFLELREKGEIDQDRLLVINYEAFLSSLEEAFEALVRFTGIEVSDALRQKIAQQAAKQQGYQRRHRNLALEDFGLSREEIVRDLEPIFEEFGFERGEV